MVRFRAFAGKRRTDASRPLSAGGGNRAGASTGGSNSSDGKPLAEKELSLLDRWVLSKVQKLVADVTRLPRADGRKQHRQHGCADRAPWPIAK